MVGTSPVVGPSSDSASCSPSSSSVTLPRDDIDKLNDEVKRLTSRYLKGEQEFDPKVIGTESIKAVTEGAIVYHHRSKLILALLFTLLPAVAFICIPQVGLIYTAVCVLTMMAVVDVYGAVLHVVLDHPPFVTDPIIGPGCLEFQWHHAIPRDICSKPFYEVLGDLNVICLAHLAIVAAQCYLFEAPGGISTYCIALMGACKLGAAFLGQWAHRSAHEFPSKRAAWVNVAQSAGLLVHPDVHHAHHKTYDDAFPILNGWSAPLIKFLLNAVPNRYIWMAFFYILTLCDVYVLSHIAMAALGINTTALPPSATTA